MSDHHRLVRRTHQGRVLQAVVAHAPVSRSKLVEITGLSKPTVLAIVNELLDQDLIRPVAAASTGAGRPPDWYEANPRAGFVVGVDLGGTKIRAALADLGGHVLAETTEPADRHGGEAVVEQITALVGRLAKTARVARRTVRCVAVGCPGFVLADGTLTAAFNVPGFEHFALRDRLASAMGTEVLVDNDVNVAAFGEMASGTHGAARDLVVLAIGTGVGAGIVIGGEVVRGARGAAGEVAYLPLGVDPAGRAARRQGSLELAVSGPALQRRLRAALAPGPAEPGASGASGASGAAGAPPTGLRASASPARILEACAAGDELAVRLVREHAELVARAVLSVAVVVDPEVVVLAGGLGANPALLEPVRRALDAIAPFPIRLERSELGERSGVVGAVAAARERATQLLFPSPEASDR
jgi:glucokinase